MSDELKKAKVLEDLGFDPYYSSEEVEEAIEVGGVHQMVRDMARDYKEEHLNDCNVLPSRDLFLSVLIANGYDLDVAFLKAIHFDNPQMYLKRKHVLVSECKKYLSTRGKLCSAIVQLKDKALSQYTEMAKINKALVMGELMKLKELAMESPSTYRICLDSLKLIGEELGMFGKNGTNKALNTISNASYEAANSGISERLDSLAIDAEIIEDVDVPDVVVE